jgi:hypothetical protein
VGLQADGWADYTIPIKVSPILHQRSKPPYHLGS